VLGVLAMLTTTLLTAMARSREPGQRIGCANNLRQLGVAILIYSSENDGMFPPRSSTNRWPARLLRYYGALAILRCPNDGTNPATFGGPSLADRAPRSFILNGWDDYFNTALPALPLSIPEQAIPHPSQTIAFGEKATDSGHFTVDTSATDDLTQVEYSPHFRSNPANVTSGGSNFAMADAQVVFLKHGTGLAPTDLWYVLDQYRTNSLSP